MRAPEHTNGELASALAVGIRIAQIILQKTQSLRSRQVPTQGAVQLREIFHSPALAQPGAAPDSFEIEQEKLDRLVIAAGHGHDIRVLQIVMIDLAGMQRME